MIVVVVVVVAVVVAGGVAGGVVVVVVGGGGVGVGVVAAVVGGGVGVVVVVVVVERCCQSRCFAENSKFQISQHCTKRDILQLLSQCPIVNIASWVLVFVLILVSSYRLVSTRTASHCSPALWCSIAPIAPIAPPHSRTPPPRTSIGRRSPPT